MAATIDDIVAQLVKMNLAMERLQRIQVGHSRRQNRRLAGFARSPRKSLWRGVGKLLKGNVKGAKQSFGRAWNTWKQMRGLGGKPRSPFLPKGGRPKKPFNPNAFGGKAWNRFKQNQKGKGFGSYKRGTAAGVGRMASMARMANVAMLAVLALKLFHDAINRATDAAVQAARKYAEVSGSMAVAVAQRDIRELKRDMEKGNRLSGSAQGMMEAEQFRKDNTKEIEILGDRVWNGILEVSNTVLGTVMAPFNAMAEGINTLIDSVDELAKDLGFEREKEEAANLSEWAESIAKKGREDLIAKQKIFEGVAANAEKMRRLR